MDCVAKGSSLLPRRWILPLLLLAGGLGAWQSPYLSDAAAPPDERLTDTWQLLKAESSPIDPWNTLTVEINAGPSRLTLLRRWHGPTDYTAVDSIHVPIDGSAHRAPLSEWPDNRHIGATVDPDRPRRVASEWLDDGRTLRVTSRFWVQVSQGTRRIRTDTEYRVAPDGDRLIVLERRSTRPRARRYVFERVSGARPGR
ncbi:MAG: hypothetical protein ABEL51_05315 [Salinibacter sp.]